MLRWVAMANPLLAYRQKNKLTQGQLAERLGKSRQMVSHLENGKREFSAEIAVLIEKHTGIDRVSLRPDLFKRAA